MIKQRGYPDRRGMGAESDFIAELFVPSEQYKAQQIEMAQKLIEGGLSPDQVAAMFFLPVNLRSSENLEDDKPKGL